MLYTLAKLAKACGVQAQNLKYAIRKGRIPGVQLAKNRPHLTAKEVQAVVTYLNEGKVTLPLLARELGIRYATLRYWVVKGWIPGVQHTREDDRIYLTRAEVDAIEKYVKEHDVPPIVKEAK